MLLRRQQQWVLAGQQQGLSSDAKMTYVAYAIPTTYALYKTCRQWNNRQHFLPIWDNSNMFKVRNTFQKVSKKCDMHRLGDFKNLVSSVTQWPCLIFFKCTSITCVSYFRNNFWCGMLKFTLFFCIIFFQFIVSSLLISSCLSAPQNFVARSAIGSHNSQILRSPFGTHSHHSKTVSDLDGTAVVHRHHTQNTG